MGSAIPEDVWGSAIPEDVWGSAIPEDVWGLLYLRMYGVCYT